MQIARPRWIQRGTLAALLLTVTALAGVAVGVEVTLQQDRDALAERFRTEQLEQVKVLARGLEADLEDIQDDLAFTSRMLAVTPASEARTRNLEVLLKVVKHYRLAVSYASDGRRSELVVDRATDPIFELSHVNAMLDEAAARAARLGAGEVTTVATESDGPTAWFRAFATPLPERAPGEPGGALVLLVDTSRLFQRLSLNTGARPILLSASGRPAPVTDPRFARLLAAPAQRQQALAASSELLQQLRSGAEGSTLIPEDEASRLGWEHADVVVAFTRARVFDQTFWSVGAINSTVALKQQERALHLRLAVVSSAIILCVLAFAGWVVRSSRREVAVRERLKHAEHVAELTSQLLQAEKLATVGMLAAGIAHEIGTPLGVVRARAELLSDRLGPESPLTPGALIIVDQIDRISRTLRQLLDFSQPRAAEKSPVSMLASAKKVVELLHYEANKRKVALDLEVPADLPPLAANPDQLQQVLVNLVMNACDACDSQPDGGKVTIRAGAPGEPGRVRIEVADNGCGISPELKHRVFDPFFTTKKRGKGTGLGLTVAAQIVRSHGGRIDFESAPGEGTRVFVAWPTQPSPSEVVHGRTA